MRYGVYKEGESRRGKRLVPMRERYSGAELLQGLLGWVALW